MSTAAELLSVNTTRGGDTAWIATARRFVPTGNRNIIVWTVMEWESAFTGVIKVSVWTVNEDHPFRMGH